MRPLGAAVGASDEEANERSSEAPKGEPEALWLSLGPKRCRRPGTPHWNRSHLDVRTRPLQAFAMLEPTLASGIGHGADPELIPGLQRPLRLQG